MKRPHVRAIKATLNSLEFSTDLWVATENYTIEAHGRCSYLQSHKTLYYDEGIPGMGKAILARNHKHGIVISPHQKDVAEYDDELQKVYQGRLWFPEAANDEYPALDIIEGQIPRIWVDGIFADLEVKNPLLEGSHTTTVVWVRTMRPSLVEYVFVGLNGEYPASQLDGGKYVPVFYGSSLWAAIRNKEIKKEELYTETDPDEAVEDEE